MIIMVAIPTKEPFFCKLQSNGCVRRLSDLMIQSVISGATILETTVCDYCLIQKEFFFGRLNTPQTKDKHVQVYIIVSKPESSS